MTTVLNVRTGDAREFDLPPEEAVVAVHRQFEGGDTNFDMPRIKVEAGDNAVICGDWVSMRELEEIDGRTR